MNAACPIAALVAADIASRAAVGLRKYGTTLARTDLARAQWLEHAYEEALDLALYLRRLMEFERPEAASAVAAALVPDTPRPDMPQIGPVGRLEAGAGVAEGRWCGDAAQWGVAFPNTPRGYEAMLLHIANRKETT